MVALDKETGDVVWKRPRLHLEEARIKDKSEPSGRRGFPMMAYSTPLVINVNSKNQLVSTAADHVAAYDLLTGNEIWWHPYDGFSVVARPIQGRDCIFVVGFEQQSQPVMFAIRPDARGKITKDELVFQSLFYQVVLHLILSARQDHQLLSLVQSGAIQEILCEDAI